MRPQRRVLMQKGLRDAEDSTHAVQQNNINILSFDHLVGAPGITAATPSGLMLKAKNVKGISLGFPH